MCILCDMQKAMAGKDEKEAFPNRVAARDALQAFIDQPQAELEVGTTVERNAYGESYYHVPRQNQAAVVTKIYDTPRLDQAGTYCDIEITLALAVNTFVSIPVSSKFFRAVNTQKSNVHQFGKRL